MCRVCIYQVCCAESLHFEGGGLKIFLIINLACDDLIPNNNNISNNNYLNNHNILCYIVHVIMTINL